MPKNSVGGEDHPPVLLGNPSRSSNLATFARIMPSRSSLHCPATKEAPPKRAPDKGDARSANRSRGVDYDASIGAGRVIAVQAAVPPCAQLVVIVTVSPLAPSTMSASAIRRRASG